MHWFFVQIFQKFRKILWNCDVTLGALRTNLIHVKLNFTPILAERIVWWKLWKRINILSWLKRIPLLLQWSLLPVGMTSLNSSFQACTLQPSKFFKKLCMLNYVQFWSSCKMLRSRKMIKIILNLNPPLIMCNALCILGIMCKQWTLLSLCASRVWRVPLPRFAKARRKLEF